MRKLLILIGVLQMIVLFACCNKSNQSEPQQNAAPTSPNTSPGSNPSGTYVVGTVDDICGNTYNYIKIGNQYWMAENLRCNKYDTKSEMPGKTLPQKPSKSSNYDWHKYSGWSGSGYSPMLGPCYREIYNDYLLKNGQPNGLSLDEMKKWGYVYSWGAAVGLANGEEAFKQTSEFIGHRQGICPNGWHVPKKGEWDVLIDFIEGDIGFSGLTGKCLKSKTGWSYLKGTRENLDKYGFDAIPTASSHYDTYYDEFRAQNSAVSSFWTSTPTRYVRDFTGDAIGSIISVMVSFEYASDNIKINDISYNCRNEYSVRCIKD